MQKYIYGIVGVIVVLLVITVLVYPTYASRGYSSSPYGEEISFTSNTKMIIETRTFRQHILLINDTPTFLIRFIVDLDVVAKKVENITVSVDVSFQHNLINIIPLAHKEKFHKNGGHYHIEIPMLASTFVKKVFGGFKKSWNNTQGYFIIDITVNGFGKISNRLLTASAESKILVNLSYTTERVGINSFVFGFILGAIGVEMIRRRYGIEIE